MNNLTTTLDSREVAEMVGKEHRHLLRDIETYSKYLLEGIEPKIGLNDFFISSTYKDRIGRSLKCYKITKKGCELIAHKMTGQKGVLFTAEYINRFHEMEQALKEPKPDYQYQPKTYKGQPVVTLQDLAHFSKRDTWMIRYQVKHNLKENTDYAVLQGCNLAAFKAENGKSAWRFASCLVVIFKSGFLKLTKLIAELPKQLECFKAQLPAANTPAVVRKRRQTTNMPDVKEAQRLAKEIKNQLTCIDSVLQLIMRYNDPQIQDSFALTIEQLGWKVAAFCCDLKRVKYLTIDEPY